MRSAIAVVILCAFPASGVAWIREPYEDIEVVERSELIVVGHLRPGSVAFVDPEHHATLVITEVVKGKTDAKEIPIIIHDGLDPFIEGALHTPVGSGTLSGTFAKGSIQIVDGGNSARGASPLVDDATADNLWFLRKGRKKNAGDYGIVDPEDLQPLALKDYLALYLEPHPETAIRAYAATHPDPRITKYLDHVEIQRALKLEDRGDRVDRLLPYFVRGATWGRTDEVQDGIIAAGAGASGPRLLAIFAKADQKTRASIITIWGRTRFSGAVDTLIDLLVASDAFWAAQQLHEDWWSSNLASSITAERRSRYSEVLGAVVALGLIADRRARPALELTRRRWRAIKFANPEIVDASKAALKHLTD